jgi:hypothetical protein
MFWLSYSDSHILVIRFTNPKRLEIVNEYMFQVQNHYNYETSEEFYELHGFVSQKLVVVIVTKLKAISVTGRAGP